jgi:hypothetical protein
MTVLGGIMIVPEEEMIVPGEGMIVLEEDMKVQGEAQEEEEVRNDTVVLDHNYFVYFIKN